ncbi:MAG: DUF559 domain-containing protein [Dermatophilus congolensis]|nr:DUF559 domain-containing protein [Dermatophilus congolensis]
MALIHGDLPKHVAEALRLAGAGNPFGLFSVAEAEACGLPRDTLQKLVRGGQHLRVERGWYMPPGQSSAVKAVHRRRAFALIMARERGAVASHHSALLLHGLPVLNADLRTVHLMNRQTLRARRRPGLVTHSRGPATWHFDDAAPLLLPARPVARPPSRGSATSFGAPESASATGSSSGRAASQVGTTGVGTPRPVMPWGGVPGTSAPQRGMSEDVMTNVEASPGGGSAIGVPPGGAPSSSRRGRVGRRSSEPLVPRNREEALRYEHDPEAALLNPAALAVPVEFAIVQSGRLNGPLAALVAADQALRFGSVTRELLGSACAAYSGAAGQPAVTRMLRHCDGRSESAPESLARHALTLIGYTPTPQLKIELAPRWTCRVDLALEAQRLVIEIDGAIKYQGSDAGAVVVAERRRHKALNKLGWKVLRLMWEDIIGPGGELRTAHIAELIALELAGS